MKKVIKGLVKGTFSPLGLASIGIESDLFHNSVADGTRDGHFKRQKQILLDKLPKETRKKLKTFKQFQEEMMGGGTPPTNSTGPNVCTDPDTVVVKKKRKAWNKGKKYMKGSRKQWMV